MKTKLAFVIGTWFGCGYAPVAPGTAGSLAALLIAWLARHFLGWGRWEILVLALVVLTPAVWASGEVARSAGRKDPGIVVVDEVVGQWITLAGVASFGWVGWGGAFVLFRLFDIWKPAPVRQLEKLCGGAGIMADDVMAGVYGALILAAAGRFGLC